jgi:hypothetical protein
VAVIANASVIDEAIRSKTNLFASFLLNDDVSTMLENQREFRTPAVAAEETSCREALQTLECVARLGAVAAHEGRERSEIAFDEQVWRERICAAVEARAAHAAAQTIQAAWEKRQRRHNPNYSSKRDLKARQQFVDSSLHSHTSVCLTMLRDVALLIMAEHESIHRLAVEKAAYTAASHVVAEAAAHSASMREAAARRASDARRSIEAEEASARGAVVADFASCWQSYLKEFAVRSAESAHCVPGAAARRLRDHLLRAPGGIRAQRDQSPVHSRGPGGSAISQQPSSPAAPHRQSRSDRPT